MSKRRCPKTTPEFRQLVVKLRQQGWTVALSRGDHLRVVSPSGQVFFMPSSSGDRRAWLNNRAMLRRAGADL